MQKSYVLVETEGPFKSSLKGLKLALELAKQGYPVKLWFMQDAIQLFQVNKQERSELLQECVKHPEIQCFVDLFALKQRGLHRDRFTDSEIQIADEHLFTTHLMQRSVTPIWH